MTDMACPKNNLSEHISWLSKTNSNKPPDLSQLCPDFANEENQRSNSISELTENCGPNEQSTRPSGKSIPANRILQPLSNGVTTPVNKPSFLQTPTTTMTVDLTFDEDERDKAASSNAVSTKFGRPQRNNYTSPIRQRDTRDINEELYKDNIVSSIEQRSAESTEGISSDDNNTSSLFEIIRLQQKLIKLCEQKILILERDNGVGPSQLDSINEQIAQTKQELIDIEQLLSGETNAMIQPEVIPETQDQDPFTNDELGSYESDEIVEDSHRDAQVVDINENDFESSDDDEALLEFERLNINRTTANGTNSRDNDEFIRSVSPSNSDKELLLADQTREELERLKASTSNDKQVSTAYVATEALSQEIVLSSSGFSQENETTNHHNNPVIMEDLLQSSPDTVSKNYGKYSDPVGEELLSSPQWNRVQPEAVKQTARTTSIDQSSAESYPWSRDVNRVLKDVFKLNGFRPHQLEAINATLQGKDVLVLMPTGGGKSLCYQLPALVKNGFRSGITIVISPLISLMQDQVFNLKKKNVHAEMLNSRLSASERNQIMDNIRNDRLDLVYISPEMLNTNTRFQNCLQYLNENKKLARIVIDEAHCVSSWGHDFRPDYKMLDGLKATYKHVPIMALTATANKAVVADIRNCLRLNAVFLKQSFNRINLIYEVRQKNKDSMKEVVDIINKDHSGESGIIYCGTKEGCEKTSEALSQQGVSAAFYHAGLDSEDREKIQQAWQRGHIKVICATIAFGMGIDKPDVRFVIHWTMPSSMEGYYQETGRAGRDGNRSECILFFSPADATKQNRRIQQDRNLGPRDRTRRMELLRHVTAYCQNRVDCRRKQVLQYFNEPFNPEDCKKMCDNCSKEFETSTKDVTDAAKNIVLLVQGVQNRGGTITIAQSVDAFRGSKARKIVQSGFDTIEGFSKGKTMDKVEVERIFHHLISESILKESVTNKGGFNYSYLKPGPGATGVTRGHTKVVLVSSIERSNANTSRNRTSTVNRPRDSADADSDVEFTPAPASKRRRTTITTTSSTINTACTTTSSGRAINERVEQVYAELEMLRLQIKNQKGLSTVREICSDESLRAMATDLPGDFEAFSELPGLQTNQVGYYVDFRPKLVKLRQESLAAPSTSLDSFAFNESDNNGFNSTAASILSTPTVQKPSQRSSYFRFGNNGAGGSKKRNNTRTNKRTGSSSNQAARKKPPSVPSNPHVRMMPVNR